MYILLNKDGERVGQLTNDGAPGTCPFWGDMVTVQIADDDSELTLDDAGSGMYSEFNATDEHASTKNYNHALESISIPYGFPETDEFVEHARLVYKDESNGHYYEMILTEVTDEQTDSGTWYKTAIGVNTFQWNLGHLNCLTKSYSGADVKTVMTDLLGNSGWILGEWDGGGSSTLDWSTDQSSNRQSVIQTLCQQFDVELDAYVLFNSAGQIAERKVDVVHRLGTDTGLTLRTGGNITAITRTVSADNLFTRLVVLGKNGESIASVNNGLDYIQDVGANDTYNPGGGFLEGVIQSQTIANKNALKTWGQNQLKYFNHPKTSYTVTGIIDAGLGDSVRIQGMDANPALGATSRVIQKRVSQSDPTQNQALVGEFATVKVITPSLIQSMRTEFSVDMNDLLAAVQKDASALSVHIFTPDGTDFSISQNQKRVIAQVFINNQNVTEYIDPAGFHWSANNENGMVNSEFNTRADTSQAGYLQVVNNDFHGTLNVSIDTGSIEAGPERTTDGTVIAKTFTDDSDTSAPADFAYSETGIFKLAITGEVSRVGTTDVMNTTNLGEKVISADGDTLYFTNAAGSLVKTTFAPGSTFDASTGTPIANFGEGTAAKYDAVNSLVVTKYGNTLSVYTLAASGSTNPEPLYSIKDYHSIGFGNSISSWAINYPRIYATTDANTLIAFNIINQSPLFEWDADGSGGLLGENLKFVASAPNDVYLVTNEALNLVQELSIKPRGTDLVTYNPTEEMVPTGAEIDEMERVNNLVTQLEKPDTYHFGFITDTHVNQEGPQLQRQSTRHLKTIAYYAKHYNLPLIVHGGDVVDGRSPRQQTLLNTRAAVTSLTLGQVPLIIANGNHDDNSGYVRDVLNKQYSGMLSFDDRFIPEFSKNTWKTNTKDPENPYGYYVAREDLYIVVINAFDFPYYELDDGTTKYIAHGRSAFRNGQLTWLDGVLRSIPASAQVLFISHANLRGVGTNAFSEHARNGNLITDMIVAFNKSGNFNENGLGWNMTTYKSETEKNSDFATSLSVNYDFNPTGRVIGVICGHTHKDASFYYKGINFIETLCSAGDRGAVADRTGINEDAWDVVMVSPSTRSLDLVRYGAGSDVRHYNY